MRYETERWCVEATPSAGTLSVAGEFDGAGGAAFEAWVAALNGWPAQVRVELDAMELADAGGAVALINLIRRLREGSASVVVAGAPQALGHSLYRSGLLEAGSGIVLEGMREDEPFG